MGPGDLTVARCTVFTLIRREGTGEARVADCAALTRIESQFSKHMDPWSSIWLKACPSLTEIRSHIGDLRHCGDIHLEDCASLRQLPYLRAQGALTIQGSPQVARTDSEQRRGGWIIGAPATPAQGGGTPAGPDTAEALPRITPPRAPAARPRRAAPSREPLPPGMTNACPSLDIYWEPRLRNLRNMGLSLRDQIRGLEEAGAPVEVLQAVIIHLYRPEPAWPHSHGRPYMESEATPEERLALCSWAVEVLRRPAAVIDRFGHNLLDIFAYRVACLPRERWFLGSIHDAFEGHPAFDGATMLAAIAAGLRFDSLFQSMALPLGEN